MDRPIYDPLGPRIITAPRSEHTRTEVDVPICERCGKKVGEGETVEIDGEPHCGACAEEETGGAGRSPGPASATILTGTFRTGLLVVIGLGALELALGAVAGPQFVRPLVATGALLVVVGATTILCAWWADRHSGSVSDWTKLAAFSAGVLAVPTAVSILTGGIHEFGWSTPVTMLLLIGSGAAVVASATAFVCWWVFDRL